jgi:hypothetical protein
MVSEKREVCLAVAEAWDFLGSSIKESRRARHPIIIESLIDRGQILPATLEASVFLSGRMSFPEAGLTGITALFCS